MAIQCIHCSSEMKNSGSICDLCICGGEIIRSFWKCDACSCFFYNEYFDCWDRDSDDYWYEIPEKAFDDGRSAISKCPDPSSKFCSCAAHPFSADLNEAERITLPIG
ncbi:MAG: hypothetical protein AB9903_05335 [Vulcanimicrobiota bacterium]